MDFPNFIGFQWYFWHILQNLVSAITPRIFNLFTYFFLLWPENFSLQLKNVLVAERDLFEKACQSLYEDTYLRTSSRGGVVDTLLAAEHFILVRWGSKVAEMNAMIRPDFKNIFWKKNLTEIFFFRARKVGDPSILVCS